MKAVGELRETFVLRANIKRKAMIHNVQNPEFETTVWVVKRIASLLSPFPKRGSFPLFQDAPLWQAGVTCGGMPILMESSTPFAEGLSGATAGVGVHCQQYLLRVSSGKSALMLHQHLCATPEYITSCEFRG